jgi:DNA-binding transcriptional MerR regulator
VEYQQVLNDGNALVMTDFNLDDMDIVPVATPGNSSTAQRMAKAQAIANLPSVPQFMKDIEFLKALDFTQQEIEQLVPPPNPNPQPSPQDMLMMAEAKKTEAEAMKLQAEPQLKMTDIQRKAQQDNQMQQESQARMVKMEIDGAVKILQTQMEQQKLQVEAQMNEVRAMTEQIRQVNEMLRNQRDLANDPIVAIKEVDNDRQ